MKYVQGVRPGSWPEFKKKYDFSPRMISLVKALRDPNSRESQIGDAYWADVLAKYRAKRAAEKWWEEKKSALAKERIDDYIRYGPVVLTWDKYK